MKTMKTRIKKGIHIIRAQDIFVLLLIVFSILEIQAQTSSDSAIVNVKDRMVKRRGGSLGNADREFAYDHKSHVGTLEKTLDQADVNDWLIVDMEKDWKRIFPFSK
jgi:hypothetical protein